MHKAFSLLLKDYEAPHSEFLDNEKREKNQILTPPPTGFSLQGGWGDQVDIQKLPGLDVNSLVLFHLTSWRILGKIRKTQAPQHQLKLTETATLRGTTCDSVKLIIHPLRLLALQK